MVRWISDKRFLDETRVVQPREESSRVVVLEDRIVLENSVAVEKNTVLEKSVVLEDGVLDIEYDPKLRHITVQDLNGTVAVIELDEEFLINRVERSS